MLGIIVIWINLFVPFLVFVFFGLGLITPREVSGTLFGGMFLDLFYLLGWSLGAIGIGVTLILRIQGARPCFILANFSLFTAGVWYRVSYPDDYGELIYTPLASELNVMILITFTFMLTGLILIKLGYLSPMEISG